MKRIAAIVVLLVVISLIGCAKGDSIVLSPEEALSVVVVNGMLDFLSQTPWELERISIREIAVVQSEQLQSRYYFKVGLDRMTALGNVEDCIYFSISGFDPLYIKLDPIDDVAQDKKRNQIQFESIETQKNIALEVVMNSLSMDTEELLECLAVEKIEYYYHGQMVKSIEKKDRW